MKVIGLHLEVIGLPPKVIWLHLKVLGVPIKVIGMPIKVIVAPTKIRQICMNEKRSMKVKVRYLDVLIPKVESPLPRLRRGQGGVVHSSLSFTITTFPLPLLNFSTSPLLSRSVSMRLTFPSEYFSLLRSSFCVILPP